MFAGRLSQLPEDTQTRFRVLVTRSAADPDRPKLPADDEKRLHDVERRSAACYAEIEETTYRYRQIAKRLNAKI